MKFTITQEGRKIVVKISMRFGFSGFRTLTFDYDCGDPAWAGLAAEALQEQFEDHINTIRRNAYLKGWQDKTKRKRKCTFFDYCANYTKLD